MTILFREDWLKYPTARIHYETPNKSFIKLAEIYHAMGVENNAFMLAIHDPMLIGVNPRDPNLSKHMKERIVIECTKNFWYYLREVVRVSADGGMDGAMFLANRSNIALFWLYFNHITTINTVIRQTGKTTNIVTLYAYLLNFAAVGTSSGILTKDSDLKGETMDDLKEIFDLLPPYLNMSSKKDIFNSDRIEITKMKNDMYCKLSSASEKQAMKAGRGHTFRTIAIDECAFVSNVAAALSSLLFSGNKARTEARRMGQPYGTIMTTTAGKTDDRDGGFIHSLLVNGCQFVENFFDCKDEDDLNDYIMINSLAISKSERKAIVNLTMTYRQMGYSDEWMALKLREATGATKADIERDMFNKWSSGSQSSPLSPEDAERLHDSRVDDPRIHNWVKYKYIMRWYITDDEVQSLIARGVSFAIGVDTSDGGGRDDITFNVRASHTGEVIATAVFNEINLNTMANFFADFLIEYKNAFMIPERRSSAPAIIDAMITRLVAAGENPFKRIYNTIVQNKDLKPKEFDEVMRARPGDESVFIKYKTHLGFTTSGHGITSRNELFGTTMYNALRYTAHITRDALVINQTLALVIKNGRVDHPVGGRDDAVVAWLLSYWVLYMGRNLHVYGVNTSLLLKENSVYRQEKQERVEDKSHIVMFDELESEIRELMDLVKECDDAFLKDSYIRRIKYLRKDLKTEDLSISVEELLSNTDKESTFTQQYFDRYSYL